MAWLFLYVVENQRAKPMQSGILVVIMTVALVSSNFQCQKVVCFCVSMNSDFYCPGFTDKRLIICG